MSYNQNYLGTKVPSFIDTTKADMPIQPGIYVGIVKQVDTNTRTGRLRVYVDKFGGNDPEDSSQWRIVNYASPFAGSTNGANNPYATATPAENTFAKSQQTYGFYMTPPDPGSAVLCCFIPGSPEGYWFACINTSFSRYMTPAIGAAPWEQISDVSVADSGLGPVLRPGRAYPVAETNENIQNIYNSSAYLPNIPKPIHIPQTVRLIEQGLDGDNIRGAIISSSQRDPVSTVFGFSTPGRPLGTQDPAINPTLRQKLATGDFTSADFTVTTRVGGHSLIMDDGDIYGKNNLTRIKTAQGHQILMNDSEGLMYIANSTGTAWIELTRSGDILVYGAKDFSVRTQGNLMMHSDQNINFYAKKNVNIQAVGAVKLQGQLVQTYAETALNLYGKQAQIKGQSGLSVSSGGPMSIKSSGAMAINGSTIALNGGGGGGDVQPPTPIANYSLPDTFYNGAVWVAEPGALRSSCYKLPTHEPYIRGNIGAEIQRQQAQLNSLSTDVDGNPINPPLDVKSTGPEAAANQPLSGQAPTSVFINQPTPAADLGILGTNELRAYMAQTGYSESRGNYQAENQFGYQGKYQLGSLALQDLGYVKIGTPQTPEALNNPNNWTGKNGVGSAEDFRNSASIQEQAMYDYTRRNYSTLEKTGVITASTTKEEAAGLLSAAHLIGAGGARTWYETGKTISDANGTTASTYYNRGVYSQTQVSVLTTSDASKQV